MGNFSMEAFAQGCKDRMLAPQHRECAAKQVFDVYCGYLLAQKGGKQHG